MRGRANEKLFQMVPVRNLCGGLLPSAGTVVTLAKARRKCGSVGLPRGECLERYPGMAARSDSVLLNPEIVPPRGLGILWT